MLSLTRYVGEEIVIETSDGRVSVFVVESRAERVKLAFDAPESVRIYRREVWDKKQAEQEEQEKQ